MMKMSKKEKSKYPITPVCEYVLIKLVDHNDITYGIVVDPGGNNIEVDSRVLFNKGSIIDEYPNDRVEDFEDLYAIVHFDGIYAILNDI